VEFRKSTKHPPITVITLNRGQDVCPFLVNLNAPGIKWLLAKIGESLAKQVHACPYQVSRHEISANSICYLTTKFNQGAVIFNNVTVRPQVGAFTPPGLYKADIGFGKKDGEILFDMMVYMRFFYPKKG
jgi:hypothetical protein